MSHRTDEDDWDDGETDSDDDDSATVACPYCERQIYDGSLQCPYCKNYISDADQPSGQKPWWIVVGVLVCLYMAFRWIAP